MKPLVSLLIIIVVIMAFSSCESDDAKRIGEIIKEAEKIILTEDEFATLKAMEARRSSSTGVISIDQSRVIDDADAKQNNRCETPSFEELFELYNTGKKRNWLIDHGFEVNYCIKMMQDRGITYENFHNALFIGYGKCYYKNNSLKRRVGLRVTHTKHQRVDYQTTFKESIESIEKELNALDGVELTNESKSGNSYRYMGVPINFRTKEGRVGEPTVYELIFKSTYEESMLDFMSIEQLKELKKSL